MLNSTKTKWDIGTKGQWDISISDFFQFGQKSPIIINIYIINIYINNIYINSYKTIYRPTTLIPDNAKTICPNVPCPVVPLCTTLEKVEWFLP